MEQAYNFDLRLVGRAYTRGVGLFGSVGGVGFTFVRESDGSSAVESVRETVCVPILCRWFRKGVSGFTSSNKGLHRDPMPSITIGRFDHELDPKGPTRLGKDSNGGQVVLPNGYHACTQSLLCQSCPRSVAFCETERAFVCLDPNYRAKLWTAEKAATGYSKRYPLLMCLSQTPKMQGDSLPSRVQLTLKAYAEGCLPNTPI